MKNIHFLTLRFCLKDVLFFYFAFSLNYCSTSFLLIFLFFHFGFLLFIFLFSTKFLISAEQFFPEDDFKQLFFCSVVKWEKFSNFQTTKQELKHSSLFAKKELYKRLPNNEKTLLLLLCS